MAERDESPRDPFAELTRIMGFDPRVPVGRAPINAAGQPQEPEDFGIDLEKELMGAFEEPAQLRGGQAQDTDYPEFEAAPFTAAQGGLFDHDAGSALEQASDGPARDLDALSFDGFDAAFAATLEQELALDEEWAAQDDGVDAPFVEFGPADEPVPPAAFEQPGPAARFTSHQAPVFEAQELPIAAGQRPASDFGAATAGDDADFVPYDDVDFGPDEDELSLATYDNEQAAAPVDPELELSIEKELGTLLGDTVQTPVHAGELHREAAAEWTVAPEPGAYAAEDYAADADAEVYAAEHDSEDNAPDAVAAHYASEAMAAEYAPEAVAEDDAPEVVARDYAPEAGEVVYSTDAGQVEYTPDVGELEYASQAGKVEYAPEAGEPEYPPLIEADEYAPQAEPEYILEPSTAAGYAAQPLDDIGAVALDLPLEQPSRLVYEAAPGHAEEVAPSLDDLSSEHDSWRSEDLTASMQADADAVDATLFSEAAVKLNHDQFGPVGDHRFGSVDDERFGSADEPSLYEPEQPQWQEFGDGSAAAVFEPTRLTDAAAAGPVEPYVAERTYVAAQPYVAQQPYDAEQAYEDALTTSAADEQAPEAEQAYDGHLDTPAAVELAQAEAEQPADDDPFAALAAMAAQYRAGRQLPNWRPDAAFTPAITTSNAQPAPAGNGGTMQIQQPIPDDDMPDIETVDVPEQAVALADDLDIPEVAYAEPPQSGASYDDLDAEFAGLLQEMAAGEPSRPEPAATRPVQHSNYDEPAGYDPLDPRDYSATAYYPAEQANAGYAVSATEPAYALGNEGEAPRSAHAATIEPQWADADYAAGDDLAFDDQNLEQMILAGDEPAEAARRPARRGLIAAAVVGGVALLGGLGALAMSFGDGDTSGAPVLVRADTGPLKVRPENPGGTQVPNQGNKVYETVTGDAAAAPAQEKLVTTAEEPLDVAASEPELELGEPQDEVQAALGEEAVTDEALTEEALADEALTDEAAEAVAPKGEVQADDAVTAKGEDRLEQVIAASEQDAAPELIAVAPRKVRTMIVKPDGTLVPREVVALEPVAVEPPPAGADAAALKSVSEAEAADAPAEELVAALQADEASALPPEPSAAVEATDAVEPAETATAPAQPPAAEPAPAAPLRKRITATTPASMEVAPGRPAEQPVDVVGEVKADQTAALTAPATGSWSMQIASQPSEDSARSTYADLARRYGSVLGGRGANIVKAEVAGKGTYYRVRVPASSRNEAVELCSKYKAAGGNCFVSK